MFSGYVIYLRDDIGWPPSSPDMKSCEFFPFGLSETQGVPTNIALKT